MAAVKRIANEVRLQETVLKQEGVHIAPDESNPLVINLYVVAPKEYALPGQGPSESPYKGKRFHVKVTLGENYPHACPEVSICVARPELNCHYTHFHSNRNLSRHTSQAVVFAPGTFYHPLVDFATGQLCHLTYSAWWGSTCDMLKLGARLREFMSSPTSEGAVNIEAQSLLTKAADFFAKAKLSCASVPNV